MSKKTGLVIVVLFAILCIILNHQYNRKAENSIWSDQEGYYMYLPAVLIYDGFENYPVKTRDQFKPYPGTNKIFTKYTCGVALLQLPFFIAAHTYCTLSETNPDGLNYNYGKALNYAAICYCIMGFILLFSFLKERFSSIHIYTAFLVFFVGTNLYYYSLVQGTMSHVYNFFLASLLIWFTPRYFKSPGWGNHLILGFIMGMIILIRPVNMLMGLFVLFYNVQGSRDLKLRFEFFIKQGLKLLLPFISMSLVFLPQFFYWNYISGHWLLYSYEKEGFNYWMEPRIFKVLFGVWNGWILYSPSVLLSIAGLIIAMRKKVQNSVLVFVMLTLATYVFASWWYWWFGGAFGHRCFVDYYPFLILFLVYFFDRIAICGLSVKIMVGFFILICCYYNIAMTNLYTHTWPWDGEAYTWDTYWSHVKKVFSF